MSTQAPDTKVHKSSKPFWELVKVEGKLALREPTGIIFGLGLPLFLLVIFGSIPAFRNAVPGTSLSAFEVYIPILMVTVLIFIGLFGLPYPIARDREIGWLRRISTTPVSPTKLLAAQVTINITIAGVAFAILSVGSVLFGVKGSFEIPGFVLSIVLATIALFSLGVLIAALAPSQGVAAGMAQGLLYPLLFFAGIYIPIQFLPGYLQTISNFTPVGAAVQALDSSMQGTFPSIVPLLVMAAYTVFFVFVAIRYFRWE
ncbi:MAG: ABC transporter permease [Candidatus Bathyarchaeia archaeon]|jgi:ABC-2 type transport system permease protein